MNLVGLALFAFVGSITPGPNNVMLWASGLNFGFRRTVHHLVGINLGFTSLFVAVALGLGEVFERVAWFSVVLRIVGSAYLLYLAYRVATAGRVDEVKVARPLTVGQAAAFQYVNPKAWVLAITAAGSFLGSDTDALASVALAAAVFSLVNIPCISIWAGAGSAVGRLFNSARSRRIVNVSLGVLLAASVYLLNT